MHEYEGNKTKLHCKHCNERLAVRDGHCEKYSRVEYINPRVCSVSGDEHEPR